MYEGWAKRSILLSYENNREYFKANGYENISQNDELEGLSALDINHDYLGYFYIKYLPNLDGEFNQPSYGDLSPEEYYHDVFISINSEISSFSFLNNYPILIKQFIIFRIIWSNMREINRKFFCSDICYIIKIISVLK